MGKPHVHVLMDVSTRAQTDVYCSARGTDEQAEDIEGSTCVAPYYLTTLLLTTYYLLLTSRRGGGSRHRSTCVGTLLLTAHVAPKRRQ